MFNLSHSSCTVFCGVENVDSESSSKVYFVISKGHLISSKYFSFIVSVVVAASLLF